MSAFINLESVASRLILRWFGPQKWPDIDKAPIMFVENELSWNDEFFDKRDELPIGCCPECRFGRRDSWRNLLKFLGAENEAPGQRIREIFSSHHKSETGLMSLIGVMLRHYEDLMFVMNWADQMLDVVVCRRIYSPAKKVGPEPDLKQMFETAWQELELQDAKVREHLDKVIANSMGQKDEMTELAYVLTAMIRRQNPDTTPTFNQDDIKAWFHALVRAMYDEQIKFHVVVSQVRKTKPVEIQAMIKGKAEPLNLFVLKSDEQLADRAARFRGAHLTLIRDSKGYTRICRNRNVHGLNLNIVLRMIRWLELPIDKKDVKWSSLDEFADYSDWEMSDMGNLLNRAPNKPSPIALDFLADIMQYAFHPGGIKCWCNQHNIWMSDTPPPMKEVKVEELRFVKDDLGKVMDSARADKDKAEKIPAPALEVKKIKKVTKAKKAKKIKKVKSAKPSSVKLEVA
ncbi:MAG: hypothetical protein WC648_04255 [Candidatus Paceibacterota bacterium]|jgi:hypothetical protein